MLWILSHEEVFGQAGPCNFSWKLQKTKTKNKLFCNHTISNIVLSSLVLKISVTISFHHPRPLAPTEMKDLAYLLTLYSNWTIFCSMLLMFLE